MITEYQILKPLIENHITDEKPMYKDFDKKEVLGIMVCAPSVLRKEFVMNKVKNLIVKKQLNLSVSEEGMEFTTMFKINCLK